MTAKTTARKRVETLKQQRNELVNEAARLTQRHAEINAGIHQIDGAIAVLDELFPAPKEEE